MIADCDTNVVYLADTLEPRFSQVYRGLKSILAEHGIPLRKIPGTRDIWCRDYMPVQVAEDRFVQFRYAPDYLTRKYRHLRRDGEIGPTLPWVQDCIRSQIVLDVGNIVRWRDKVIMTEKIFSENTRWERRSLVAEIHRLLEVDRVIFIPQEPGDVTGHADGAVRFVDGETVVANDYREVDRNYRRLLLRTLKGSGLEVVEIPYRPSAGTSKGMPSAVGNYVNFLRMRDLVVLPNYGLSEDEDACRVVRGCLSGSSASIALVGLDCRRIASEGGVLNCVTWSVERCPEMQIISPLS
jgi:agmatine deiminase